MTIDFGFSAQGKAVESLVGAQVAEHGLDGGKALTVTASAVDAVDAVTHVLRVADGFVANQQGDLVPSMAEGMAIPPNVQQAIFELLASYFSDPQGDAEATAKQLAKAVQAVRAEN